MLDLGKPVPEKWMVRERLGTRRSAYWGHRVRSKARTARTPGGMTLSTAKYHYYGGTGSLHILRFF
jgi:hypothetical protein